MMVVFIVFIIHLSLVSSLSDCPTNRTLHFKLLDFITENNAHCDSPDNITHRCDLWVRISTMGAKGGNNTEVMFDNGNNNDTYNIDKADPGPPHEFWHKLDESEENISLVVQFLDEGIPDFIKKTNYSILKNHEKEDTILAYGEKNKLVQCLWQLKLRYSNQLMSPTKFKETATENQRNRECWVTDDVNITFSFSVQVTGQNCLSKWKSSQQHFASLNGTLIALIVFTIFGMLVAWTVILGMIWVFYYRTLFNIVF